MTRKSDEVLRATLRYFGRQVERSLEQPNWAVFASGDGGDGKSDSTGVFKPPASCSTSSLPRSSIFNSFPGCSKV